MEIATSKRGVVEMRLPEGTIYLYTHKYGGYLIKDVFSSLSKREFWEPENGDYLTRLIFAQIMPQEEWIKTGGFGIGLKKYPDVDVMVSLNTDLKIVTIYKKGEIEPDWAGTYDRFIKEFFKEDVAKLI